MSEPVVNQLTRRELLAGSTIAAVALVAAGQSSSAQPESKAQPPERHKFSITRDELKAWTVDFVAGLQVGNSLIKCLTNCGARANNEYLKQITTNILAMVEMGYPLSDALEVNRAVFSRSYIATVRYGEIYGILDETLDKMLQQWDHLR